MRDGAAKSSRLLSGSRLPVLAAAAAVAAAGGECATSAQSLDVTAPPEAADADPSNDQVTETIIVTGSRIPRPELTAISPVTVIDSKEVDFFGASLTEDLINALPQAFPDQGNFLNNQSTGTATVNLRGLGAVRTLVLVNGRRLLPGDPGTPVPDINTVPTALIERVDVLTGGASSVYGSDAIAGVVNFILDTEFSGFRIDGHYSFFQHQNEAGAEIRDALVRSGDPFPGGNVVDGGSADINAAFGADFADGRGHVAIYGGYRKIYAITQDRRDYSACALTGRLSSDILDCGGSLIADPANFRTRFFRLTGEYTVGPDRSFIPGGHLYNFAPTNYWQRPGVRWTAGGFANFELSDAIEPYAEVMYIRDRSEVQIAPGGNFFSTNTINCDNPLLSAQQNSLICFTGNFVGETPVFEGGGLVDVIGTPTPFVDSVTGATYFRAFLSAGRRNVEGGPRQSIIKHESLRLLGGLRGDLGHGWSYDGYFLTSRVDASNTDTGSFSLTRLRRALDVVTDPATGQPACRSALTAEDPSCVPWDIFVPGAVSPESVEYLQLAPSGGGGWVKQRVANASLTGSLGEWGIRSPWADEAPALNIGLEYRKDLLDFRPNEVAVSGDIAGGGPPPLPVSGSTTVKELFGEIQFPIVTERFIHNLSFEGGYRYSWQDNGQNRFTTNSYKLGLDFSPIRAIRFRASLERAVRAPNIQELFTPVDSYLFEVDPCVGANPAATQAQCALTGVTPAQYGGILANPDEGYNAIFGGNPALDAEVATTKSIGVVLRPDFLPGFSATVDWYDIDVRDAVSFIDAQRIMDTCIATADSFFCDRIHRDSSGSLWQTPQGFVDDRNANIGGIKARGIDVSANYSTRIGRFGSVDIELLGSWLDNLISDAGGLATPFDCAGLYGPFCSTPAPEWRHKARLTWNPSDKLSLSLQWRHFGSVQIGFASDQIQPPRPFLPQSEWIRSQDYFDLTGLFQIPGKYILRLGVRNVFDREPPIVLNTVPGGIFGGCFLPYCNGNTFPQIYDPLGRQFFAGITVDF